MAWASMTVPCRKWPPVLSYPVGHQERFPCRWSIARTSCFSWILERQLRLHQEAIGVELLVVEAFAFDVGIGKLRFQVIPIQVVV